MGQDLAQQVQQDALPAALLLPAGVGLGSTVLCAASKLKGCSGLVGS